MGSLLEQSLLVGAPLFPLYDQDTVTNIHLRSRVYVNVKWSDQCDPFPWSRCGVSPLATMALVSANIQLDRPLFLPSQNYKVHCYRAFLFRDLNYSSALTSLARTSCLRLLSGPFDQPVATFDLIFILGALMTHIDSGSPTWSPILQYCICGTTTLTTSIRWRSDESIIKWSI